MTKHFISMIFVWTVFFLPFLDNISVHALEPVYNDIKGKAIRGYDPVAYFEDNKAVKGDDELKFEWNGAEWNFSSKENLDKFVSSPERYSPQYGGYCAWAVSQGYTASTDPEAWHIHNGKLYLNYSRDIQKKWSKDIPGNIKKADSNWPVIINQ